MKYSLWYIDHESECRVSAQKHKDTNSTKEVKKWEDSSYFKVASFYRPEEEINADYLQTFEKD